MLQEGRFADAQESRFQAAKRSEMCSTLMKGLTFFSYLGIVFWGLENFTYVLFRPDMWSNWWFSGIAFQASKLSNMGSAFLENGRSADFPNYVLKMQNFQIFTVSKCKGVYLLIEWHIQVRNTQIKAVPSWRWTICSCSRTAFSRCGTLKYRQCCPAMKLTC